MTISEDMNSSEDNHIKRKDHNSGDAKSPKRRRDADQRILDQFWLICDPNPLKRNKSLKIIIEILSKQNELNEHGDLMYCLERVIRGMASARQFARHGFCVLLTQILSIFESKISLDLVFNLSEKHLGKMDELSNHDSVIGWALVMGSVIKSQRLSTEDKDIYGKTFDVLYTLGMNKPYIELVVSQLFEQFVALMANKKSLFAKIVSNKIKDDLETENKFKPFFVFVCLTILDHFPNFPENKSLKFMVKKESFQKISIMIRESTSYHPSVHPFHKQLINYFIKDSKRDFEKFWNNCIDNVLISATQSEKGFLGFELIKISLQLIKSTENVSVVLSPSFVRLFIQSLSGKTHPLHSASQQLSEFLINFIKTVEDSELQLKIVDSFTKQPGSLLFDDISKSRFFSNLLRNLNSDSIKEWTQKLKTIFLTTDKVDSNDILRIRCIQQISNLCKSLTSNEETDNLWSNIKFLFFHSYFEANQSSQTIDDMFKSPVVPIGDRLRNSLKDGFKNTFNLLLHLGSKTSKEKLTQEVSTLSTIVDFINELISNDSIECLKDSDSLETFKTIVGKVSRLRKKLKSNSAKEIEIKIFISLYSMLSIQLFEEDSEEIQNIIPDLNESVKRALSQEAEEDDSAPIWSDVLTDLILSLLTTPSKLTKNVLFSCFKHICCQITNNGIQRLVDAIIPSNDNKLFAGNEDSDEEEDEEVEDEEVGDRESEKSESESESEDENQNTEIDEKFRNDVINALGPAAHNDEDEESVYLSDNEMFQIDETLATVFKSKFSDKKESIDKKNSILSFRIRCLELIQILLGHKDISLDQVFVFIEPIVSVAKTLTLKQNQITIKAIQLITQITKIKDSGDNSLEINDFKNALSYLLVVLSKTINLELQKALIPLITWIITLSKKLFPKEKWYYSDIETALKSFFEKNNCQISSQFFKNLITVHNEIGFNFYDTFFEYAFKEEIRPFKRSAAIELILILCKTKTNENCISIKQMEVLRDKSVKVLCEELVIENLRAQYVSELLKLFNFIDKNLKQQKPELRISETDFQVLTARLKSLSKKKKQKLTVRDIVRKIISNTN